MTTLPLSIWTPIWHINTASLPTNKAATCFLAPPTCGGPFVRACNHLREMDSPSRSPSKFHRSSIACLWRQGNNLQTEQPVVQWKACQAKSVAAHEPSVSAGHLATWRARWAPLLGGGNCCWRHFAPKWSGARIEIGSRRLRSTRLKFGFCIQKFSLFSGHTFASNLDCLCALWPAQKRPIRTSFRPLPPPNWPPRTVCVSSKRQLPNGKRKLLGSSISERLFEWARNQTGGLGGE